MYANQGYRPPHSRGFSFGAALAINAAIIAGLIYSAPNIIPKVTKVFTGTSIPIDETPPPPPLPQPKIKEHVVARAPLPTAPKPVIQPQPTDNTTLTTDVIPDRTVIEPTKEFGKPVIADPPTMPPPLLGAAQDPRYLRDFQPEYPSSELRAQRDGQVRVKILIGVDGRVKAVEQVSATSTAFFEVTKRQALGKWRFKPASRGGVPEESWKVMNVRFELENAR